MTQTTTIKAGESAKTITLPEGMTLIITGGAGALGVAYHLDPVLGGTNSLKSWAIGAGALAAPIGPFANSQKIHITCQVGSIDATVQDAVLSVSGGAIAAVITGSGVVGQPLTATLPAGVIGTLQFTKTLLASPFTKSNIAAAVANAVNSLQYTPSQADLPYRIGCDASNTVSPSLGVTLTEAPAAPASIRNVINRGQQSNVIYGSALQVDGHSLQKVFGNISRSQAVFVNTATYLEQATNAQTYKCSVEYPIFSGNLFHYTFNNGASRTGTCAPNSILFSDWVDHFMIPEGALVHVRMYCTSPSGCVVTLGGAWKATGTSEIDRFDFSNSPQATVNLDHTETDSATYSALVPNMYATQNYSLKPFAILGMSSANSIAYIGDSRGAGASSDIDLAPLGLCEHQERIGGAMNPGINFCMSNEKGSDFVNPARRALAKQLLAMGVCQIAHISHATNSMDGVATSAALIDEDRQVVSTLKALGLNRFWVNTTPARIGSHPPDRLTTYSAQGLSNGDARRRDLNIWRIANAEGLFERVYDVVPAYNDSTSGAEKITIAPRARAITADFDAATGILTLTAGTQFTSADEKYGAFSSGWTAFSQGGNGTTYRDAGRVCYLKILSPTTATLHMYHGQKKVGGANSTGQTVYIGADMPSADSIHYGPLGNAKVTAMFQNTVTA